MRAELADSPGRGGGGQPLLRAVRAGCGLPLPAAAMLAQARLAIDALASLVDGLEGRLGEAEDAAEGRAQPAPAGLRPDRRGQTGRRRRGVGRRRPTAVTSRRRRGAGRRRRSRAAPTETGERRVGPAAERSPRLRRRPTPSSGQTAGTERRRAGRGDRRLPGPELHRPVDRPGRAAGQPGGLRRAHHPLRATAGVGSAGGDLRPDRQPTAQLAHLSGGRPAERPHPQPGGPADAVHGRAA